MVSVEMQGNSITSAPRSRSIFDNLPARSLGRVMIILRPNSGRKFFHANLLPSAATPPTMIIAGECIFSLTHSSSNPPSVPSMRRCFAVEPFSTAAAGETAAKIHRQSPAGSAILKKASLTKKQRVSAVLFILCCCSEQNR